MPEYKVAMVGLGVMGANLLLNLESKGFPGLGFDINAEAVSRFLEGRGKGRQVGGARDWGELAGALEKPRKVFLLVPAGKPVDSALESLSGVLEPGDVIVECGNSYWRDTARREQAMAAKGFNFTGMGVSGGEEGALHGPSLMPGGPEEGYRNLAPQLERIAAQSEDGPCVTYIGPGGAGHYVKMVHNGIEYGNMQLIAEAYDLLKRLGGLSNEELADTFAAWNQAELDSFLVEISATVLRRKDEETGRHLVDVIKDTAAMKGTGTWTVLDAFERGVAVPTIAAAVEGRQLSGIREERLAAAERLTGPGPAPVADKAAWKEAVRSALFCSIVTSYAQGMNLLRVAGAEEDWGLRLPEVARIWKAGCIIRARLLRDIQAAYERSPALPSLLIDPAFSALLAERQDAWRQVVSQAQQAGIAVGGMASSLAYYDAYRSARLPANLVQAQRDLFGAHTYERLDKPGSFHTEWE